MPIEIRELVIKATIAQNSTASAQTSATTFSANAAGGNEQVIATCVEKVLEIIKSKMQR
ncbi:MAG: hypothetical protein H7Y27_07765 [Gemmatimonadaceae bacterium]|nr:hypothetical protein [Chitinophagaceae bacterium]